MAKVYATPGVYIEEKSAFPNSAVPVATAVPAFIGYTEKAIRDKKDITNVPTRISSFGEYLMYFGEGPKITYTIAPDANKNKIYKLDVTADTQFLLFNCLKSFFSNGGSDCYIVSIGDYDSTKAKSDFSGETVDDEGEKVLIGITALKKYPEPTMLVIPDAVLLEQADCFSLQQEMLIHCGQDMRSRVAILDVFDGFKKRKPGAADDVVDVFRGGVGNNFLDFGAAYYPWVHTTITGAESVDFTNINAESETAFIDILNKDVDQTVASGLLNADRATEIKNQFTNMPIARTHASQQDFYDEVGKLFKKLEKAEAAKTEVEALEDDADAAEVLEKIQAAGLAEFTTAFSFPTRPVPEAPAAADGETPAPADGETPAPVDGETPAPEEDTPAASARAEKGFSTTSLVIATDTKANAIAGLTAAVTTRTEAEEILKDKIDVKTLHQTLLAIGPLYKSILASLREKLNLLPPSAAMAGIYSMVDNNVGVFQSPANISVGSVVEPSVNLTNDEQEDLNIPLNGKAVNAIRTFPGKGVLVWGARTLDGNSQDWRYVSVRRTMIFIEQSIKIAAEAYVFEPNTASTWTNLKALVTNFLTNVWQQGALAGATAEDAFSVDIGLGVTMTPVDILDGYMKMTVKVAVTRPAEFIVITFQQQMQKS